MISHLVAEFGLTAGGVWVAVRRWNHDCAAPWSRAEVEDFAANLTTAVTRGVDNPAGAEPLGNAGVQQELACVPAVPALTDAQPTISGTPRNKTDQGNAERFVELFGTYLRYVEDRAEWRYWSGSHWCRDDCGAVYRAAVYTARQILQEAEYLSDEVTCNSLGRPQKSDREKMQGWAMTSEGKPRQDAMIALGGHTLPISCQAGDFDRDPYLLCTPTKIVDLRNDLKATPCLPTAMLAKCTKADYVAGARSAVWHRFVNEIFQGDQELLAYVQRAVGMSLIGVQREHVFFFCWGDGKNGKSTFLNAISNVLGEYAGALAPNVLIARRNEAHPTELADLEGRRMVIGSEVPEGCSWDEVRIKGLTGGDNIKARTMRKDFYEFPATHTFWMTGNHKPIIKGTDAGIWRRVRLVPFTKAIPEEQLDRSLGEKFQQPQHMRGILAWCLDGARSYVATGLGSCTAVESATETYRLEEDLFGQFISECCVLDASCSVDKGAMRKAVREWFEAGGYPVPSDKELNAQMARRRVTSGQIHAGGRVWRGVGLARAGGQSGSDRRSGGNDDA